MGRLGLGILKKKEKNKSAEATSGSFAQRIEESEAAELMEFVHAIQEKNKKIKSMRLLLLASLILIFAFGLYIVFTQPRNFHKSNNEETDILEMKRLETLNEQYFSKIEDQEAKLQAMNVYKIKLEEFMKKVKKDEINHKRVIKNYDALQQSFISLQIKYNDLINKYEQVFDNVDNLKIQSEKFSDENPINQPKIILNKEQKGLDEIIEGLNKRRIIYNYSERIRRINEAFNSQNIL